MKDLSLFAGIGAFEKALDNLKIPYELVGFSEIDKYAVNSYCAIHGVDESINLGDITKIDEQALPKDIDLVTYGFPCQDISLAGKQKGLFNADGTQTRSGLFFEALRIIEATQPRVAIAENVKNLTSKKFSEQFKIVLDSLEAAGYNNYWKVLNAKDYGIPQNRERVFIVSIRKDIDTGCFRFPEGFPLELRLKDMLEEVVDEQFYIDNSKVKQFVLNNPQIDLTKPVLGTCHKRNDLSFATRDRVYNTEKESPTLTSTMYKDSPKILQIAQMYPNSGNPQAGRIYDAEGISPAMDTCSGGNRMPKVAVEKVGQINSSQDGVVISPEGIAPKVIQVGQAEPSFRIRKLTPKECFRLMGFEDSDFEKAEKVNSNTQLYKQAGNSICVPVVEYITKALLECGALEKEREEKEMELKVNTPTFPEVIEFNFEELKKEITERASAYVNLVYTDDQIKDAKNDRAALNKFVKALSDERIKVKKECMKPYEDFEAKIKELDGIVNMAIKNIDSQIKAVEEKEKDEKLAKIKELWESIEHPTEMTFEHVYEGKFLNKSVSMSTVEQYMKNSVERFKSDIATLQNLPEFSFEAVEVYKQTMDMHKAISEGKRLAEIQKKKAEAQAEQERLEAESATDLPTEPLKQWVSFKALLTTEDAFALKDFFAARNIEFRPF